MCKNVKLKETWLWENRLLKRRAAYWYGTVWYGHGFWYTFTYIYTYKHTSSLRCSLQRSPQLLFVKDVRFRARLFLFIHTLYYYIIIVITIIYVLLKMKWYFINCLSGVRRGGKYCQKILTGGQLLRRRVGERLRAPRRTQYCVIYMIKVAAILYDVI